tara:strand:+ start:204 stop:461 length:258 start_codon:yes stop_codon:yes gene_type:complete
MSTVNNSSLPINIKKVLNHLAPLDRCEKLSTGLKLPNAGPIFPSEEAVAPMAEIKSNPKKVNRTDPKTKMSMYSTKKDNILNIIV